MNDQPDLTTWQQLGALAAARASRAFALIAVLALCLSAQATIDSTVLSWSYATNGATTVFPYTSKITAASHLVVKKTETATGAVTTLVLATDYTVAGIGAQAGGSITTIGAGSPIASGFTLTIDRVVPLTQPTVLASQGGFFPKQHEGLYDRLTQLIQQVDKKATGTPTAGAVFPVTFAEAAAGVTPSSLSYPPGDLRRYGAIGDGSADDTDEVQDAFDAVPASGGAVYVPTGIWKISANVVVTKPTHLSGDGRASILRATGSTFTAVLEFNAGSAGSTVADLQIQGSKTATGGTIQRGVYVNGAKDVTVAHVLFSGPNASTGLNFGVDVNGAASARAKILHNRFERLVSNPSTGTAILLEATSDVIAFDNTIDGAEFVNPADSPSSAIFLSQSSAGAACTDNWILSNRVVAWPQAGIALGSTTYAEFLVNLGANQRNVIEGNDVGTSSNASGGDASSGIVVQGNSPYTKVLRNRVHNNGHASAGGYGIALVSGRGVAKTITGATNATPIVISSTGHGFTNGQSVGVSLVAGNTAANGTWTVASAAADTFALQGSVGNGAYTSGGKVGLVGTVKIDESPSYSEVRDNEVYENQDDGIVNKGVLSTDIVGNFSRDNGQRTAATFRNIYLTSLGGALTSADAAVRDNRLVGTQPLNQLAIGAGVAPIVVRNNLIPSGGTPYAGDLAMMSGLELAGSATYDPPSLADGAGTTTTVTVTGAGLTDYSDVAFSLDLQGIAVTAWISAADTVSVRFQNESGGVLDLASGTLRALVERP